VTYYNDAIATIPEATIYAIETLGNVDTLIFGGMDRGIDYSNFIEYLAKSNVKNLIAMKDSGYKIADKIKEIGTLNNIYYADDLKEAVKLAKENTKKGTICLMSPSAPSYNDFKNFEEKGTIYKELVRNGG
jgi:UDP-N-acetylmuramoylalanine--D-glutamate ligase